MRELNEVLRDWEAVIGLEIHTELTTLKTKMFCGCRLSHDDAPNTNVCPVCLGLPGALPVPNREAIRSIVKAGLATNCQISRRTMFYRKHYFYPDMAKNFQTTQGPVAFCMHGRLDLEVTGAGAKERPDCAFGEAEAQSLASASANAVGLSTDMAAQLRESGTSAAGAPGERGGALAGMASYDTAALAVPVRHEDGSYTVPVRILRIHMEEDAAKMVHLGGEEGRITSAAESLIDYNRCGTPLIELVTEPDLRTPEEARLFMEKLRQVFVTLGISDCSMEKGSMRCDGNVSLRRRGETRLGTKTSPRTSTPSRASTTAWPTRSAARPRCWRRAASSTRRPATGSPAAGAPWSCAPRRPRTTTGSSPTRTSPPSTSRTSSWRAAAPSCLSCRTPSVTASWPTTA